MMTDSDLENDQPEDIYITMDPHAYIPPPQTYEPKKKSPHAHTPPQTGKSKKKRSIFKAKKH